MERFRANDHSLDTFSEPQLSEHQVKQLVSSYGLATVKGEEVSTVAQAITVAETLGFPVVLKAVSPTLIHKSDVGGVHLNLESAQQVQRAHRSRPG